MYTDLVHLEFVVRDGKLDSLPAEMVSHIQSFLKPPINPMWELLKRNPDKDWDWRVLSANPNITMEIIQNNPDKPWSGDGLSMNPNLTMEMILNSPQFHDPTSYFWNWYWVSSNTGITWEDIQNHPEIPWNWKRVSVNAFRATDTNNSLLSPYRW